MRCEKIGDATLWLGDCREVLPRLAPADLLLTDPPYRVTAGGQSRSGDAPRGGWLEDYDNGGEIVPVIPWGDWLPLIPPALADPAHAYIFTNDRNEPEARAAAEAAGLEFHRLLIWDKRIAVPNRWYQQTCEFVLFMRRGKAFRINNPSSKALVSMAQRDVSAHPTEKPVDLCEHYVRNSTQPGAVVLDPFMGSGTSGVAAIRAGRAFVGIETDKRWFEIACIRIAEAREAPRLFEEYAS